MVLETMLMQLVIQYVLPTAATAIPVLMSWGLFELKKFVTAKTKHEESAETLAKIDAAIYRVTQTTETVTKDIEGTVKKFYLEKVANGQMTLEDAYKAIKNIATQRIKSQVPAETIKLVEMGIKSANELISAKIEKTLTEMKIGR